jgi:hypothetical protein
MFGLIWLICLSVIVVPLESGAQTTRPTGNVLVDIRGNRGGNGEVAAGYLLALQGLQSGRFQEPITFLADAQAEAVFRRMTGIALPQSQQDGSQVYSVPAGDSGRTARFRVIHEDRIPSTDAGRYQLLIRLASSDVQNDLRSDSWELLADPRATRAVLPVMGSTEGDSTYGRVRVGASEYSIGAPGPQRDATGVYRDPVATELGRMNREEVMAFVMEEIERLPEGRERAQLAALLERISLSEGPTLRFGLAYGVPSGSSPEARIQFVGMLRELPRDSRATVILTPSRFRPEELGIAPHDVTHLHLRGNSSPQYRPGRIEVVETSTLPHRLFVGLMALSELPPVVSGDNALSAAISLGRPFLTTTVGWNRINNVSVGSARICPSSRGGAGGF